MKISILGAGSWGLALAQVLNDNNNDVLIYARREEVVTEINSQHTNKKYFPSAIFSEKIKATFNLKEAVQFADILLKNKVDFRSVDDFAIKQYGGYLRKILKYPDSLFIFTHLTKN